MVGVNCDKGLITMGKLIKYIPTTAISDGQNGRGFLAGGIAAINPSYKLCGKAITVSLPVGENEAILKALLIAESGDVLVVDAKGDINRAIAGDFVVSMMQKVGLAGVIIDGVIRDIEHIRALDFPVFCKGTTTAAGVKNGGGQVNVPIAIGEGVVSPGDYIFADADGVVVVPSNDIVRVIEKAQAKIASDVAREAIVLESKETVLNYLKNSKFND